MLRVDDGCRVRDGAAGEFDRKRVTRGADQASLHRRLFRPRERRADDEIDREVAIELPQSRRDLR